MTKRLRLIAKEIAKYKLGQYFKALKQNNSGKNIKEKENELVE